MGKTQNIPERKDAKVILFVHLKKKERTVVLQKCQKCLKNLSSRSSFYCHLSHTHCILCTGTVLGDFTFCISFNLILIVTPEVSYYYPHRYSYSYAS